MKRHKLGRLLALLAIPFLILGALTGCDFEEMMKKLNGDIPEEAKFVLSFHRIVNYPRGNARAEAPMMLPDGREIVIARYPTMSSHHIIEIAAEPLPDQPGFYKLFIKPDQKGKMMWMQLTGDSINEPYIILLDGIYFGEFKADKVSTGNEKWVEFPLAVDAVRAENIAKFANDNYRFFNNGASGETNPFANEQQ